MVMQLWECTGLQQSSHQQKLCQLLIPIKVASLSIVLSYPKHIEAWLLLLGLVCLVEFGVLVRGEYVTLQSIVVSTIRADD